MNSNEALPRVEVRGPHERRHIAYLTTVQQDGWYLKIYGIAPQDSAPREELLRSALGAAADALPPVDARGDVVDGRGLGFVVVHDAPSLCYVLVHWWAEHNEVHQRVFSAPATAPEVLQPHPSPAIGCVWELAVIDFERRAWLTHILSPSGGPDVAAYLTEELHSDV